MFSLDALSFSKFLFAMTLLLATAHILGYLAERLRIPRIIGEVCAGLVLGPTLLGFFFPETFQWLFAGFENEGKMFGLIYQIGVTLLMFCSGLKFQTEFRKGDGLITTSVVIGSTILPFTIGWLATSMFDIHRFLGTANNLFSLKIVIAISIAVTSIPVISKIFHDLGIMHSRFAKLIIACAGSQDVLLWVALGIATSVASQGTVASFASISKSVLITALFIIFTFLILTFLFKHAIKNRANILFRSNGLGYFLILMFLFASLAGFLRVETIFGALLAGMAAKFALPKEMAKRLEESVSRISFAWFIPIYFATVGLQLDLARYFDIRFFILFALFASICEWLFVYLSCRIIKLDRLTSFNFGVTMNARGGPGIVVSTTAFAAGIINQEFFGILVVLALVSSWMAGTWLWYLLKKGMRLMPGDEGLVPERNLGDNDFADVKES